MKKFPFKIDLVVVVGVKGQWLELGQKLGGCRTHPSETHRAPELRREGRAEGAGSAIADFSIWDG